MIYEIDGIRLGVKTAANLKIRRQLMKQPVDDFGFTLVDEKEIRAYEEELRQQIVVEAQTAKEKLEGLYELFTPLLNNLSRDPDKSYIFWPNRVEKIEAFKQKIADYIEQNK